MYTPFELLGPGVYSMVCWRWGFLSEHNTKQYYSSSGQLFSFSKLPCPTCSERWRLSFWPPPRVLPLPPWAISPRLWPSSFHWIEPQRQRVHKRVETIYTTYIYIYTAFHNFSHFTGWAWGTRTKYTNYGPKEWTTIN